MPLDPVPAESGLRFVRGSHLWGRRFVPRRFLDATPYAAADDGFELVPDVDAIVADDDVIGFDLEPGDVLAFHFRTLHDVPGATGRRRAVSFRYVGGDARFGSRPWLHSPPFDPIWPGEPLDDERFPEVTVAARSTWKTARGPRPGSRGPLVRSDYSPRTRLTISAAMLPGTSWYWANCIV